MGRAILRCAVLACDALYSPGNPKRLQLVFSWLVYTDETYKAISWVIRGRGLNNTQILYRTAVRIMRNDFSSAKHLKLRLKTYRISFTH